MFQRKRCGYTKYSLLLASLVGSLTLASLASAGPNDKVEICHFPPGNPANYQTITIGAAALPAHLAHGDFPGSCANDCNLFGSVCDDGNACTVDTCDADGTCSHSSPTNCDDSNPCTTDSCDPGTGDCVYTPETGLPCDDGNYCTSSDTCTSSGTCQGTPDADCCNTADDCDDGNLCTNDVCTNHVCSNPPVTCTAPDLCTHAACNPADGTCVNAPKSCPDDGIDCTTAVCDPASGTCSQISNCGPDAVCNHATGLCEDTLACPCWRGYTQTSLAAFLNVPGISTQNPLTQCTVSAYPPLTTTSRIKWGGFKLNALSASAALSVSTAQGPDQFPANTCLFYSDITNQLVSLSLNAQDLLACFGEAYAVKPFVTWCP